VSQREVLSSRGVRLFIFRIIRLFKIMRVLGLGEMKMEARRGMCFWVNDSEEYGLFEI
jgi:hypothetical protein